MTIHIFRIPRVITALVAGIALSVSGLQMQTVFRNPLAGPYVLGISSGAGLGVALVVMGFSGFFGYSIFSSSGSWLLVVAAWLGSGLVLMLILAVSYRIKDIMTILILGMMVGSGISAIISILQFFSRESALKAFVIWTMGSLNNVGQDQLPYLLMGFIPGIIVSVLILKPSNAIMLGENYARTMGVNIRLYRIMVFSATSLLTGTVTAFCGPVGFIGIAVPHIARMISGTSKSVVLLVYTILLGSIFMLLSDILSQLPGTDIILPLNAVTSVMGIPIVIWIILRRKKLFT
jgi:iron complex transport system permease protein